MTPRPDIGNQKRDHSNGVGRVTLKNYVRHEKTLRLTFPKRLSELLWHLRRGVRQIPYQLPVCTGQKENEDNIDEEEQKIPTQSHGESKS